MKRYIQRQDDKSIRSTAYFSMEVGLHESIPTYSGGLGVLAGDTLKTFSDLVVPVVGVTLLHRQGYFRQKIVEGNQVEEPVQWNPADHMKLMDQKVVIKIEGRDVIVQAWEYRVKGVKGFEVPIYFLDTDVPENADQDKHITGQLYGGDDYYRIKQEAVLGIGGIRILEALGYNDIEKFHMNEGHSAFLTLELLRRTEITGEPDPDKKYNVQEVIERCVFTTHTPVPAGHDVFEETDVKKILGNILHPDFMEDFFIDGKLNMTLLALSNSKYINGVAKKHTEVSKHMFPGYTIDSITNGVHSLTWVCEDFKNLYDKHIPGWKHDPFSLRYALGISRKEIWDTHVLAKKRLMEYINSLGANMDLGVLTVGFARRITTYKRMDLFFSDIEQLKAIYEKVGKFQVIVGGKAHPKDTFGKETIKRINEKVKGLNAIFVENYNMGVAKKIIPGVDVWMNTPKKPLEASGTSGMKASLNGVPHFSVLDGWWLEGHVENVTGWSIGDKTDKTDEAQDMYFKLKDVIIPLYYDDWDKWTEIMRHAIAFNGSFFNTHRMVHQYVLNSYFH